jgi:ABC-2 type transport system permease protein
MVVLLAVGFTVVVLSGGSLPESEREVRYRIGVVGPAPSGLREMFNPPPRATVELVDRPDRESAEADVLSGRLAAAVVDGQVLARSSSTGGAVVLATRALPRAIVADRLEEAGVGRDEAQELGAVVPASVTLLDPPSAVRKANTGLARAAAVASGGLVFFLTIYISNAVQEERTRSLADVLLIPLRPLEVIAGKVLGLEGLALTLLVAIVAPAGLVTLAMSGTHVLAQTALTLVAAFCWFVLQIGLFGCFAALVGATTPSQDEASGWTLVGALLSGGAAGTAAREVAASPDGPGSVIGSFLPFLAPPFMLVRAAAGNVAPWQVGLSMVLTVVFIAWLARVSARAYAGAVARAGDTLGMRSAYRAGRELEVDV